LWGWKSKTTGKHAEEKDREKKIRRNSEKTGGRSKMKPSKSGLFSSRKKTLAKGVEPGGLVDIPTKGKVHGGKI